MDVFDTLDALEHHVRESPWIPFANLRAADRETMEQLLRATHQELERAQREPPRAGSRDEVLSQAANEGRLLVEAARHQAQEILNEDRIKSLTKERYEEIVNGGRKQANQVVREAYTYGVERMTGVERGLDALRKQVEEGMKAVEKTIKETEKAKRQRNKKSSRQNPKERRR